MSTTECQDIKQTDSTMDADVPGCDGCELPVHNLRTIAAPAPWHNNTLRIKNTVEHTAAKHCRGVSEQPPVKEKKISRLLCRKLYLEVEEEEEEEEEKEGGGLIEIGKIYGKRKRRKWL
ncbi:hypothetical protein E2C01_035781 [Portunus trituberculatus]|uniref:Uncharacterized protein n=1 Tax=Portunus trituberculatus TaxID=210409 RepID=A0A5B7F9D2_PORTR|nr:hypothetical protein [Portunus trituberculatus]